VVVERDGRVDPQHPTNLAYAEVHRARMATGSVTAILITLRLGLCDAEMILPA